MYIFGKNIYLIVCVIESTLRINFKNSILKNINKIWNIEINVCVMSKVKYGLNKMHSTIFAHQMGWLDGKGIDIYPWGLTIKPHKLCNIFDAWTSHGQTWTHKIHHDPDLGEATTFPFIVFFVPGHGASTQMSFCPGFPKLESQNSQNWDSRNFGGP
jgi:hypothetical protein